MLRELEIGWEYIRGGIAIYLSTVHKDVFGKQLTASDRELVAQPLRAAAGALGFGVAEIL